MRPFYHTNLSVMKPMSRFGLQVLRVARPILAYLLLHPISLAAQGDGYLQGRIVREDLYIRDTIVRYTGKEVKAISANGTIPMPTLRFEEGDSAVIYVHNELREPTSIHWHGLLLPNPQDGVPYLTTSPIEPGETHLYTFRLRQNGTYWYHSHSKLQEQSGMYGAFIIEKNPLDPTRRQVDSLPSYTLVLSDWTNEKPFEVHRKLHHATDWYAIRKGSTQSYWEAVKEGYLGTKIRNEWKRMLAMDVSDVYYDVFTANGQPESQTPAFPAGQPIRLRVINGSSSTYFWLQYAGGKLTVVANDGPDVEPVEVDRMLIGVAETYDLVLQIPAPGKAYEFLATAEDRTKSASLWISQGQRQYATTLPGLKYFEGMKMMNDMMRMNGELDDMGMQMSLQQMDMNVVMYPEITGLSRAQARARTKARSGKTSKDKASDQQHHHPMHGALDEGTSNRLAMRGTRGPEADNVSAIAGNLSLPHDAIGAAAANNSPWSYNVPSGTQSMDAPEEMEMPVTLTYAMLRSPVKTTLPEGPVREFRFSLTGNMNRYVWSLNNKTVSEADKILIRRGENIRIILYNGSMMRHPMHLHGHFFRLLNGQGDYAPLKNVVDIMPMETDTLEFAANETNDWFFHCHILYHMMSGMGRIFAYADSPPNPELPDAKEALRKLYRDDRAFHLMAHNDFATNGNDGEAALSNTRWILQAEWRLGYSLHHGQEVETHLGRYLGRMQWWLPYAGFDWRYRDHHEQEENLFGQVNTKNERAVFCAGIQYTLPLLLKADARIDTDGDLRLQLMREDIPLTRRLRFDFMVNSDYEYMTRWRYVLTKNLAASIHYDSDMGWGLGATMLY